MLKSCLQMSQFEVDSKRRALVKTIPVYSVHLEIMSDDDNFQIMIAINYEFKCSALRNRNFELRQKSSLTYLPTYKKVTKLHSVQLCTCSLSIF